MKKVLFAAVVLAATSAFAQTGTKIQVDFTPSVSPTAVAHEIWGAAVACPASGLPVGATLLGTISLPAISYDYTLGNPGSVNCFFVKAKDAAGNTSVASNTAQAAFPYPTLAPATNVKATAK